MDESIYFRYTRILLQSRTETNRPVDTPLEDLVSKLSVDWDNTGTMVCYDRCYTHSLMVYKHRGHFASGKLSWSSAPDEFT